jgi:hypothetical protein
MAAADSHVNTGEFSSGRPSPENDKTSKIAGLVEGPVGAAKHIGAIVRKAEAILTEPDKVIVDTAERTAVQSGHEAAALLVAGDVPGAVVTGVKALVAKAAFEALRNDV